jgi:hypothetical protein
MNKTRYLLTSLYIKYIGEIGKLDILTQKL